MDQVDRIGTFRERLQAMELPQIADTIKGLDGMTWRLNHDAADGRIEHDISKDSLSIGEYIRVAAEVFAEKAGLDVEDLETMRKRVREELAKYEEFLAARWQQLFRIGAVFRITRGGRDREGIEGLFEVVGIYDTPMIGPGQFILFRKRGTGHFSQMGNRDVADLLPMDKEPVYTDDPSFLRSGGGGKFPETRIYNADLREPGTVFRYEGEEGDPRNGTWETFYEFWIVGGRESVVIAQHHHRQCIAEFTGADLPKISILPHHRRRFVRRNQNCTVIPALDIGVG